jgi:hypothetical protein
MPSTSPSSYVASFGQRLRQMAGLGQQPMMMQPAAMDQQVDPRAPALDSAPQGALAEAPTKGRNIHEVAGDLSQEEREMITKSLEDQGLDVESEYEKLVNGKHIDPGLIKKGKDGKLDKNDMGLFLIEFGLNQMKNGGRPGADTLSSTGAAALETMDARRQRGSEEEKRALVSAELKDRRNIRKSERIDKALDAAADRKNRNYNTDRDIAARKEEGEADRKSREKIAHEGNISAERQRKMTESKDRETFVDEATGDVFWKDTQEQVMVPDGKGGSKPLKGKTTDRTMTDKDFIKLRNDREEALDKDKFVSKITLPDGQQISWAKASDSQKAAYLDAYDQKNRSLANKASQSSAVPSWAQ